MSSIEEYIDDDSDYIESGGLNERPKIQGK